MDVVSPFYNIVLFKLMVSGATMTCYSEEINQIYQSVQTQMDCFQNNYMFDRGAEGWAFLNTGSSKEDISKNTQQVISILLKLINHNPALEYFGGIGNPVTRLSELPLCFDQANHALSCRYLGSNNQILLYDDLKQAGKVSNDTINMTHLQIKSMNRSLLENFLKVGAIHEVDHFVEDYLNQMSDENIKSLIFRQYIIMDVYVCVATFVTSIGLKEIELKNINEIIGSFTKSKKFINDLICDAITQRNQIMMNKNVSCIEKAKAYINNNFGEEAISLNSVAAFVNISTSYFSTLFSQEVGQTFIEYLTDIRMKKAKELLICTNQRTSDIGFEVGYHDPHYFSYIFKKTQNCTPKEYRSKGRQMNETNE